MKFKKATGFTLLEVLVVLLIVSLISTMLVQGISMVLSLRYRFLAQLNCQQKDVLQSHWFREVCTAFTPEQSGAGGIFAGTGKQIHGLSLAPLLGKPGVATQVDFNLERKADEMVLSYREDGGEPIDIGRWPAVEGTFNYIDAEGRRRDQWPPASLDTAAQLPDAVMLRVDSARGPLAWFVAIPGRHQPRPRILEVL